MSGPTRRNGGFPGASPEVIAVTSGKGGVGKTSLVANTAICLARMGARVTVIDGDLGLANLDVMFNVRAEKNILHVLKGEASFEEIILPLEENLWLVPGESGDEILLKPNFNTADPPPASSDPEFVKAVIELLFEQRDASSIILWTVINSQFSQTHGRLPFAVWSFGSPLDRCLSDRFIANCIVRPADHVRHESHLKI